MPLPLAAIAAAGFVQGGGLGGIIGGGARRREEQQAGIAQREAESNYYNFDFNQDVGFIDNPYLQIAQQQEAFATERLDQNQANVLRNQQESGRFGATTAVLAQQNQAAQQQAQSLTQLRSQGAAYVDRQRQQRIAQRYDQAGTALGRADHRLAQSRRARQQATAQLYKGIGAGIAAGAGAASAGPDASFGEQLKASGLIPTFGQGGTQQAAAAGGGTTDGTNAEDVYNAYTSSGINLFQGF